MTTLDPLVNGEPSRAWDADFNSGSLCGTCWSGSGASGKLATRWVAGSIASMTAWPSVIFLRPRPLAPLDSLARISSFASLTEPPFVVSCC